MRAVDNVSLSVNNGDFVVILGHSGSGKTTLLSLIGGLTKPDQGQVLIAGQENWDQGDNALSEMRNGTIGFIFQFASLIPTLTALENILLPQSFSSHDVKMKRQAADLLAMVGLQDKMAAFPSQLSGGQQRRIAIARAFMNEPKIILADEPTGDLDEETEHDILRIFRDANASGTTFLVVTHNRDLAQSQVKTRVMNMKAGVLAEGSLL